MTGNVQLYLTRGRFRADAGPVLDGGALRGIRGGGQGVGRKLDE